MAIGRISGPMLYNNLDRQGIDLAIDGNLIYADVTNRYVGIGTSTPAQSLDVPGNVRLANLTIAGDSISSNTSQLQLGSISQVKITGGSPNYILYTDGVGNLNFGNLNILSGLEGFTGNYIALGESTTGSLSNALPLLTTSTVTDAIAGLNQLLGNITNASGNLIHVESITVGNIDVYANLSTLASNIGTLDANAASQATQIINLDANLGTATSNITTLFSNAATQAESIDTINSNVAAANLVISTLQSQVYSNANVTALLTTYSGNISAGNVFAGNVFADTHGNVYADYIFGNTGNTIVISSTGALQVPVGTTLDRPVGNNGYIRFNSDIPSIEYFDGAIWVPITNTITDQQITPDGVASTYTLDQEATDISIIVSINGVLQRPTYAYTVVGDQITFNDTPLDSDIIDIRFLGSSVTINSSLSDDLVVAGNLTVNGNINNANFTYTYGNTQVAAYLLANPQGSTYSNANVKSYLTQIDGNIIPSANVTYSLGDSTHQWKDLWVSNNTIYIGNTPITVSNGTLLINSNPITGGTTYSNTNVSAYLSSQDITSANIGAYQTWANANVSGLYNSITGANTTIQTLNANIGTLYNGNISTQANLGAFQTYANTTVSALQANLGVTQTWANANIASINANIGGFYTWANTNFGTSSYSNTNANALLSSNTISTINTTGNITTLGKFVGDGSSLTNVTVNVAGNIQGTSSNVSLVAGSYTTTFANNGVATFPGNITTSGTFSGSGSALTGVALKTTGSWTVTTGTNTYSFTVPASGTYQLWVDCNIPNGILVWNATATVTNTNVPVVGAQYAWVYNGGGSPVDFTSIPNQFVGTGNTIVRSSVSPSATTNRFDFGINNTSGGNITVRYGWIAIS